MFSIIIKLAQIMQKVIKKYKNIVALKELTDQHKYKELIFPDNFRKL